MCTSCEFRAEELRSLAGEFRLKARETRIAHFIELMTRTAGELEALAESLPGRCGGKGLKADGIARRPVVKGTPTVEAPRQDA
jgi:hypothetical protein